MRMILSIGGTVCCGKSYILEEFKNIPNVLIWDIQTWYKENGVIVDGKMDWGEFEKKREHSWTNFMDDIQKSNADIILLETSGINQLFNTKLNDLNMKIERIWLKTPRDKVLKERAIKRGDVAPVDAMKWARTYEYKTPAIWEEELTIEEVGLYIQEIIKYVRDRNGKGNK